MVAPLGTVVLFEVFRNFENIGMTDLGHGLHDGVSNPGIHKQWYKGFNVFIGPITGLWFWYTVLYCGFKKYPPYLSKYLEYPP